MPSGARSAVGARRRAPTVADVQHRPPLGHLRAFDAALHGAWRGALMGAAYAAVVVIQAHFIDVVAPLAPEAARPIAEVGARWGTTSFTALTGTAGAGLVYLLLWHRHRRRGWAGYEGHRVVVAGFTCYLATGAIVLGSRMLAWNSQDGFVAALGATPPLALLAAVPPVVFATTFARAALEYRRRPAPVR